MFGRKKEKAISTIDKLVTGVIIGSAVASIFGLSKTKKGKKITQGITKQSKGIFVRIFSFLFGKK